MKKITTIIFFILLILLGTSYKDPILAYIQSGGTYSILMSILFVGLLVFFPIVPFVIAAGIIGAVYGTVSGALICLAGAMLGSLVMFGLARYGFQDWAQKKLQLYPKASHYQEQLEDNAFLAILGLRLIPIVPSPILNILCGVATVRWITFTLATLIGKIPAILVYTYAGNQMSQSKWVSFGVYGLYTLVILIGSYLYYQRKTNSEDKRGA